MARLSSKPCALSNGSSAAFVFGVSSAPCGKSLVDKPWSTIAACVKVTLGTLFLMGKADATEGDRTGNPMTAAVWLPPPTRELG
jgi:hypothetical protein